MDELRRKELGELFNELLTEVRLDTEKIRSELSDKTKTEEIERVSNRRAGVNKIFLSLSTGLMAAVVAIAKELAIPSAPAAAPFQIYDQVLPALFVTPFLGFLVAIGWLLTNDHYYSVLDQLRQEKASGGQADDSELGKIIKSLQEQLKVKTDEVTRLNDEISRLKSKFFEKFLSWILGPVKKTTGTVDDYIVFYALPGYFGAFYFLLCCLVLWPGLPDGNDNVICAIYALLVFLLATLCIFRAWFMNWANSGYLGFVAVPVLIFTLLFVVHVNYDDPFRQQADFLCFHLPQPGASHWVKDVLEALHDSRLDTDNETTKFWKELAKETPLNGKPKISWAGSYTLGARTLSISVADDATTQSLTLVGMDGKETNADVQVRWMPQSKSWDIEKVSENQDWLDVKPVHSLIDSTGLAKKCKNWLSSSKKK